MAASVIIDWKDGGARFVEQDGAAMEFSRTCFVTGLTAGSGSGTLTSRILEAKTALDSAGFAIGATTTMDANLRVSSRDIAMHPEDNSKVIATINYKAFKDTIPPLGSWLPKLSGSLNQIQTAKDLNGFPITLAHTFPDDDPNWHGQTVEQGAKVNQFRPLAEITYVGLLKVSSIFNTKIKYLGKTNSSTWNYGGPGRWLCTNFTAELFDKGTTPDTWLCEVTFQADGFLWTQTAVFVDPATGKEPEGLVSGVGIKNIVTQFGVDFNELIPSS